MFNFKWPLVLVVKNYLWNATPNNSLQKIEHDLSCQFEADDEEDEIIEPIYKTRPNKFLIPSLTWGPNNQLRGFRESVIMAIQLNRTLCIPPFYKHKTDSSNTQQVRRYVILMFYVL